MNTNKLLRALQFINKTKFCNAFNIGVYAADTLPKRFCFPAAFIINTDTQDKSGEQWVAFFIDEKGNVEYLNSYGLPPIVLKHLRFYNKFTSRKKYNTKEMQSLYTKVCGQYCFLYLYARMMGKKMKRFQDTFSKNHKISNDQYEAKNIKQIVQNLPANHRHDPMNHRWQHCCIKANCSLFSHQRDRGLTRYKKRNMA